VKLNKNECPTIKNHSAVYYNKKIVIFGGYDGKKNHNIVHVYDIETNEWSKPNITGANIEGRNGHTSVLIDNKMCQIFIFKKKNKKKKYSNSE